MIKINFNCDHYFRVRKERENKRLPVSNIILTVKGKPEFNRCVVTNENGKHYLTSIK